MITIEDVTEEIVGEIVDEHDDDELINQQIDKKTFILSGRSYVENVNKEYDLKLTESDEYETAHSSVNSPGDSPTDMWRTGITKIAENIHTRHQGFCQPGYPMVDCDSAAWDKWGYARNLDDENPTTPKTAYAF